MYYVRLKEAKGLTLLYLAVVNIVTLKSFLFTVSPGEIALARVSFPHATVVVHDASSAESSSEVLDLGALVSRKKDFVPAITRSITKGGFRMPDMPEPEIGLVLEADAGDMEVGGKTVPVVASDLEKKAKIA